MQPETMRTLTMLAFILLLCFGLYGCSTSITQPAVAATTNTWTFDPLVFGDEEEDVPVQHEPTELENLEELALQRQLSREIPHTPVVETVRGIPDIDDCEQTHWDDCSTPPPCGDGVSCAPWAWEWSI